MYSLFLGSKLIGMSVGLERSLYASLTRGHAVRLFKLVAELGVLVLVFRLLTVVVRVRQR